MRENKGSEYDGMVLHSIFFKVLIRMGKIGKIKFWEREVCGLCIHNTGSAMNCNNLLIKRTTVILHEFDNVL